ncbi:unnamed protein product [Cylicocyclus nassatus]|uniref:Uncharacterized protein n=1 Tax=Cylicocyclus nassatus TaxID=53992 RepID=A0AA36GML8_CYLNA|nr:unnamed protein product [Cylicocyclus nassatus]
MKEDHKKISLGLLYSCSGRDLCMKKERPRKKSEPALKEQSAIFEAVDAVKKQVANIQSMDKYTHFGNFVAETLRGMPDDASDEKINVIMTTLISKIQYVDYEGMQQNASDASS